MNKHINIFGREIVDAAAIRQLENCMIEGSLGSISADCHFGYSMPVGGCVAYPEHISVSGVGWDIACGNMAVKTNLSVHDIDIKHVMDMISAEIGFGVGRPNPKPIDHPVFDRIANADFAPQRNLLDLARTQLGTVGSGNHYVDVFADEQDSVWVGVHFGSRGFGHKTATGFIALSQGLEFGGKGKEGSMDSPPILFNINSQLGQDYLAAMSLAGEYAYAGRETVVDKVLEIMGGTATFTVHNHHNFAWNEEHFGQKYWVVRKGCTPAQPGQLGFIGSTMADLSVIVEGVDSELSRQSLYTTVHGAGRVLSRTQAAGKNKWVNGKPVRQGGGLVDYDVVKESMRTQGVELRGGAADEAPQCYKKLDEVLAFHGETIKVNTYLRPIGVAMASTETVDPYKD